MADIELVIKIPEVFYEALNQLSIISCGRSNGKTFPLVLFNAIKNGTVLPKGHGKLIDADEYQKKINSVFPCKDRDDTNIRRATEMGLKSITTIIKADKKGDIYAG